MRLIMAVGATHGIVGDNPFNYQGEQGSSPITSAKQQIHGHLTAVVKLTDLATLATAYLSPWDYSMAQWKWRPVARKDADASGTIQLAAQSYQAFRQLCSPVRVSEDEFNKQSSKFESDYLSDATRVLQFVRAKKIEVSGTWGNPTLYFQFFSCEPNQGKKPRFEFAKILFPHENQHRVIVEIKSLDDINKLANKAWEHTDVQKIRDFVIYYINQFSNDNNITWGNADVSGATDVRLMLAHHEKGAEAQQQNHLIGNKPKNDQICWFDFKE